MSGIHDSTGGLAAREGLKAAIESALDGENVDIYDGFDGVAVSSDWVLVGPVRADLDAKEVSARRQMDETLTITVNFGVFVPGRAGDPSNRAGQAWARAFALLSTVQRWVSQGDRTTLGGAVLWCLPGGYEADGEEYDGGFQVEIAADFVCRHRIRAA